MDKSQGDGQRKRQPFLRIPLSFEDALSGLLAIDPKKLPKSARPAVNKRAAKKAAKKKRGG
jgi:hypothetical protein